MAKAMGKEDVTANNAFETVLTAIRELYADIGIPENLSENGCRRKRYKILC